ncbi:uncharacterized protein LOC119722883 [Patiria miniata]|uniref:BHLH domain-containing protein n=1 Tax=Patiria miniata TaxID=46514 RepID=A0A913ZDS8_PATMI|nr:uncharacterized protein LOC119722883 [Patiria miniata]
MESTESDNLGVGAYANGNVYRCPSVDFMNFRSNEECGSSQVQYTRYGDTTSWQLPASSENQACLGHDTGWSAAVLRPVSPAQVTAQSSQDAVTHHRFTTALQVGLNTPPNAQPTFTPYSTPPPPQPPPPHQSSSSTSWLLSSSITLLQQIADSTTVRNSSDSAVDLSTRGSRVFTSSESSPGVSGAACVHTSPAVPPAPGPSCPSTLAGAGRLEAQGAQNMPCIHDETCVMTETFVSDSRKRSIVNNWTRGIAGPVVVLPNNNLNTNINMYIEVDSHGPETETINPGRPVKTSEAISKKNYFLRREDRDAEVASSETMVTGHISRSEIDAEETNIPKPVEKEGKDAKRGQKSTKRRHHECHGRMRSESPNRQRLTRTPPPITRTPHPDAPVIPGVVPGPVRPILPSSIKAIPLQIQPLDSRPLSPISHLKTPVQTFMQSTASTTKSENSVVDSTTHRLVFSGAFRDNSVTDVPIRPVPITGTLRPYLAATHPRYLPLPPVQFPPRPLLPIPLPPLALTGAPLNFFHPGIPIVPQNQTFPPFTNLPHHAGLSVPIFKRPPLFPSAVQIGPDSVSLRQRYGAPIEPPRRQPRRRRRSSTDSQPVDDGPEAHQARRKQANARERDRVNHLNSGFEHLKQVLPFMHHGRRISKVDTLRAAIDYINHLQRVLWEADTASYLNETRSIVGPNLPTADMCNYIHHHHHYPRIGFLPTSFTFAGNTSRTAVETCSRLELAPPPTKIPRLTAPPPPHDAGSLHWLHGYGGIRVPFANGPSESSTHVPASLQSITAKSDVNNNDTGRCGNPT